MRLILALTVAVALAGCPSLFGPDVPEGYIQDDDYTAWVIEIDHVPGMAPAPSAIDLLQNRLESMVQKDTISIKVDETDIDGHSTWSREDVTSASEQHQDEKTGGRKVVTHVLYVDGQYEEGNALGVAFGDHQTVAIFKESIQDASNVLFSTSQIERAVLVHEFGHVLGLVDWGTPMVDDHEDDEHPNHSDNRNSVMYWAVETTDITRVFSGGPPTSFDEDDQKDICEAGGKC